MTRSDTSPSPTIVSGAGTAFVGYLSYERATSGLCAFSESCPLLLGQPACYVGFALFAAALLVSLSALLVQSRRRVAARRQHRARRRPGRSCRAGSRATS